MVMKRMRCLFFICFLAAMQAFAQNDSLQKDSIAASIEAKPMLKDISSMIYGKFGYGFYDLLNANKNESRMTGIGVVYEINRWQFGPELDFFYQSNSKFFRRFSVPHFKLNLAYAALNKKNHKVFVGGGGGTIFKSNYSDTIDNITYSVFGVSSNVRLSYRYLSNKSAKRNINLFPELFAEYGMLYAFERGFHSPELKSNYFLGRHFNVGCRLSLAKKSVRQDLIQDDFE
jgi:hypothetical protein